MRLKTQATLEQRRNAQLQKARARLSPRGVQSWRLVESTESQSGTLQTRNETPLSEYQILTVLAAFAFFYSVVASRLERTAISGAVVYLFAGLACGPFGLKLIELDVYADGLKRLAEFTLSHGTFFGFREC